MKATNVICFALVTLLIFSVWVAFALLIINPYLYQYIPGYRVGSPCGWELVALAASLFSSYRLRSTWEKPCCEMTGGRVTLCLSDTFTYFVLTYIVSGILIFLWQYSKFSSGIG